MQQQQQHEEDDEEDEAQQQQHYDQEEEDENKRALELVKRYGASYISRLMGYGLSNQPGGGDSSSNLQQLMAAAQFEPKLAADLLTCIREVREGSSSSSSSSSNSREAQLP